jgi:hypothetical protein
MNQRIKELAEKAGFDVYGWNENELEKFAELIVRECMRMCDVAAVGYETHDHNKEAYGCYSAKVYIEEHFGVEE